MKKFLKIELSNINVLPLVKLYIDQCIKLSISKTHIAHVSEIRAKVIEYQNGERTLPANNTIEIVEESEISQGENRPGRFSIEELIPSLKRILTDPNIPSEEKDYITQLLEGHLVELTTPKEAV